MVPWLDITVPLLVGLVPAVLSYLAIRRTLKVEREKAAGDERVSGQQAVVEISGSAAEVVVLLRDEVRRLSGELGAAADEIVCLKQKLKEAGAEKEALAVLVETNRKRNEELSERVERADGILDILRAEIVALKKQRKDLIRQNGLLVGIAERTVAT